jgi:hypothetical protein
MKKNLAAVVAVASVVVPTIASAQVAVNGQVQVGVQVAAPQVQVVQPQVQVAQPVVQVAQPQVQVAQPVAVPVVVTATQWREADDDPEKEPPMVATIAPPQAQVEVQGAPRAGHIWVGGNWRWRDGRWAWRRGRWMRPRMAGAAWVPGHWEQRGPGYHWVHGQWQGGGGMAVAQPGVVVANPPGPGVVVARPNGAVVVNTPGPGVAVVRQRPNGAVVINQPGPGRVVVGPHGGVHIRGGGRHR